MKQAKIITLSTFTQSKAGEHAETGNARLDLYGLDGKLSEYLMDA